MTLALRCLCRHFFLTYSLVYIKQLVFLAFLNASCAQSTVLRTLDNSFFRALKLINGEIVSSFFEKVEVLNKFFTSQCSPVKNSSTLPPAKLRTNKVIDEVSFSEDDITQIIKKLDLNK